MSEYVSLLVLVLQIASYFALAYYGKRMIRSAFQDGFDRGVTIALRDGMCAGYLRAMSDDDATRRETVAQIYRRDDLPPAIRDIKIDL